MIDNEDDGTRFDSIAALKQSTGFCKRWFAPDAMRFFDSKIESEKLIGGYLFVTSERPPGGTRMYTVRAVRKGGNDIADIGGFRAYATLKTAINRAREACGEWKDKRRGAFKRTRLQEGDDAV
jgi:hypothetical protein